MHFTYERTIFRIDVLAVEIRFDEHTADALRALAASREPSPELTAEIAALAYHADDAYVEVRFYRDVPLHKFVKIVRKSLERARRAGLIDEATFESTSRSFPEWFASLEQRGIERGDRFLYRVKPASMRTVVVDHDGAVLLDRTDTGAGPRLALFGAYFAPGSEFRNGLVASLSPR